MDMFDKYMQVMYDRDLNVKKVEELEAKLRLALRLLRESRGFVDCDNPLNVSGQIELLEEVDAFLLLPVAKTQHSVPAGWKLVPEDATLEMVEALKAVLVTTSKGGILRAGIALNAAIAAAPGKED
ncbi:hypothetical protein K5_135 [Pseudomonas phage K5]|uniref:Uncharacterized protein n=2 Tax=Pakpunavirus TaxID=1921407 RepID=G0YVC1_9CAUD|nr:hypothetical protein PaP1_gp118 [Pseudomonas phage PaP1]YP_009200072.1 hypothetical protein K8_136 [Pseudomonas phage K8]YP_009273890.1 hypothetical protein BH773_gp093 [Pseudomonas phage K5]YP_010762673.1 hypothetical protein QE325_gp094 [Pseudomonas phage pPA-3099-2aT.2]YP_010763944.1 hypothetical protein QE333_gp052 [Pseudomonas phage vB_PaeM_B31]KEH08673.1 hypothetical protein GY14_17295 [Delftia tsuruhatensis]KEH13003.1 hypothetical protein GY15_16725 [Delftia sp. 670]AEK21658.1 hypo